MTKTRIALLILCLGALAWAQTAADTSQGKTDEASGMNTSELQRATEIVQNLTTLPADKGVPREVLSGAKCVAVIPKLVKGAFVVGGEHGKGVATCRTASEWSAPAPFSVSGISWGPQIGGKSTDLMMFIMNDQGMQDLMSGHFKVGANVSAVAGPVGRQASAEAGWKAGILTYSSSKGAFIGASLNGAEIHQDNKATQDWYGSKVSFKDILTGQAKTPNAAARAFVNAVQNAKESAQNR
ncbi:MAG TPA: lipid-binding SYLF domain-containing protein [Candidatus Angelobacter sp.]|nr:lipid-binding SYLF domain-containing protein [Candidatus Angelobacter sp.]